MNISKKNGIKIRIFLCRAFFLRLQNLGGVLITIIINGTECRDQSLFDGKFIVQRTGLLEETDWASCRDGMCCLYCGSRQGGRLFAVRLVVGKKGDRIGGSVVDKNQVSAAATDGEFLGQGFVQRALPPAGEIAYRIFQSLGPHTLRAETEDGNLRTRTGVETAVALCRHKYAVIGIHVYVQSRFVVGCQQADVAQRMILASAGSADNGYPVYASFMQIMHGFGLVVGLLVGIVADDGSMAFAPMGIDTVSVTHNPEGDTSRLQVAVGRPIATHHAGGVVHQP